VRTRPLLDKMGQPYAQPYEGWTDFALPHLQQYIFIGEAAPQPQVSSPRYQFYSLNNLDSFLIASAAVLGLCPAASKSSSSSIPRCLTSLSISFTTVDTPYI